MAGLILDEEDGVCGEGIRGGVLQRWLFHLACVLALAAPALINGQPFYFPDTTAYTRAADSAVYVFSGHRISTEWTDRYRRSLDEDTTAAKLRGHVSPNVNDLGVESIMAGRSPYFGALLWLAFVLSRFWLFVFAQAAIAYALIRLALRLFGFARPTIIAGVVAALTLLTSLPFFVSLLMPDLLAAFGILGFLLLAIDSGRLRRGERWALYGLILISVVSHLIHIMIVAMMALLFVLWARIRRRPREHSAPLIGASALIVLAGLVSVMITSAVVERTFGSRPLMVPLLTARFLADGPGLDYVRKHCPGSGFAACAYRDRPKVVVGLFLWSLEPGKGAYMIADAEQRRALSTQDKALAWAVLRTHPVEQSGRILYNGWRQLLRFDIDTLDTKCAGKPRCWSSLPSHERATLFASPGGRGQWPEQLLAALHYLTAGLSLLLLIAWLTTDAWRGGEGVEDLVLWCVLLAFAMMLNALLGGGVSDPQPRYQARIIWLLPFVAMLAGLLWRRRHALARADG